VIFLGCSIWLYLFCILIDIEIEIFLNGHDIVILNVKIFFLDPPLDFQTVCIYDLTLKGCSFIPYLLQCQPQIQRNLLYKDESVCVCECMCVCVCVSSGLPPDPHKPSPWNLAWTPHFTQARHRARGNQKFWPPGVPRIVTPSEIPWRVKNWVGTSKQKLLLRVGLPCKILFVGGSPKPGACRVHPTKWGCMLWELAGGHQTKVAPRGGFVILFVGGSPQPKARRVLRSICTAGGPASIKYFWSNKKLYGTKSILEGTKK
jgi:hypothetical protein